MKWFSKNLASVSFEGKSIKINPTNKLFFKGSKSLVKFPNSFCKALVLFFLFLAVFTSFSNFELISSIFEFISRYWLYFSFKWWLYSEYSVAILYETYISLT